MMQKQAEKASCPHCGNPFTIPAGTFTLLALGGVMKCNVCTKSFFCGWKGQGRLYYRSTDTFQGMATWTGPPLFPERVAKKDGSMGTA